MIERYGKKFDIRTIDRNLVAIRRLIANNKEFGKKKLIPLNGSKKLDCRICHDDKLNEFLNVDGYVYFLCNNCDSIVLGNLPDVKSLYDETGVSVGIYTDKERLLKRIDTIATPKVQFIFDSLVGVMNLKSDDKKIWLDIGCGVGEVLMAVKQLAEENELGISPIGVESDIREISVGKDLGLDIKEEFFDPENISEQMKELLSKSNIVSLFNTLEHIVKPDKTIDCLSKYMPKNSILVIEVPRHPSLASYANLTAPSYIYRHITPPIHLQIFSEKGIELLLNKNYKLFAKWGFGQGYTDMLTNAMLASNIEDSRLYNDLLNINNEVQKVIDEAGYSDQMIYIVKKI